MPRPRPFEPLLRASPRAPTRQGDIRLAASVFLVTITGALVTDPVVERRLGRYIGMNTPYSPVPRTAATIPSALFAPTHALRAGPPPPRGLVALSMPR